MILDIWTISVLICGIGWLFRYDNLSGKLLIKQLFPTFFGNNWYMTCYILFYPAHKVINRTIKELNKRELLMMASSLAMLYIFLNYVRKSFFASELILWMTIYFVIAYIKKYLSKHMEKIKTNILMIVVGFVGNAGIVALTDIAGIKISFLRTKTMYWHNDCSPFIIVMALGLFYVFKNFKFSNRYINYVSKLSLFIYVIHENEILRTYYRPLIWHKIFNDVGYRYLFFWIFGLSVAILAFGVLTSMIYHYTVEKTTNKVTDWLLPRIQHIYSLYEEKILAMD